MLVVAVVLVSSVRSEITEKDCSAPANQIIRENCRPGNDSRHWDVNGDGDPSIQGFSDPFSVAAGKKIVFKIKTDSVDYQVDIFRVGWYWGAGARHLASLTPSPGLELPQVQPDCVRDGETFLYDCAGWEVSVEWRVPPDSVSGVHLARLTRRDGQVSWRTDNSQYPADSRFSFPDDQPGHLPAPPLPWPHAYGAQGHGQLHNSLHQPKVGIVECPPTNQPRPRPAWSTLWCEMTTPSLRFCSRPATPPGRLTTCMEVSDVRCQMSSLPCIVPRSQHLLRTDPALQTSPQSILQQALADQSYQSYQHSLRGGVPHDQVARVSGL